MSDGYLAAISHADRCIATVLEAITGSKTIIITSDHGGHDQPHGTESEEDMTIPLIIHRPAIPPSRELNRPMHITDIAPTITSLLRVGPSPAWRGSSLPFAFV